MISDLDEVLRRLLIRELPIRNGEVNVEFQQPKREWSSRLSRPTLNLFLYHMSENTTLRQPEWEIRRNGDGTSTRRRTPVRMDLHYMITAWAAEPEDEHRLLTRTLMALFRTATLPDDLLPSTFKDQPVPIPIRVADPEFLRNPADLWNALDNELRPAISCLVTLALNPYQEFVGPLVRTRELRFGQATGLPLRAGLAEPERAQELWAVGGRLQGKGPFEGVSLTLVERGLSVSVQPDGRYTIGNLEAGSYTLEVSAEGRKPRQQRITVPSASYDIET
ncbi:MAG: Pvc16 family protein [Anaerolineae bacterium]|nr:Pvc16 family protein [Anaerolineae bacterium]